MEIKVSVIICSYNRINDLLECLKSIDSLEYPFLEIILVDNGSTDGTLELIKKEHPLIKTIKNSKNMGTSYARNQAINIAQGEYLWFLDSDSIIINKKCLDNMLTFFENNKDIGSVGGQIIKENYKLTYWIMGELKDKKYQKREAEIFEYSVHYLPTCNCMMKKSLMLILGGFDTNYFYYCEDLDVGLKIRKLGLKNVFKSDCCVLHSFSQNARFGDYYLMYRNLLRCLIMNKTFYYIIYFPFTQSCRIFLDFIKFKKEGGNIKNIKTIKDSEKNRNYSNRGGILKLALKIISASSRAYLWNVFHLFETIRARNTKPEFLEIC